MVISAHRQGRPWLGDRVAHASSETPIYDSDCYFCPGNARISGAVNSDYQQVFVFDNDHPCVSMDAPTPATPTSPLYLSQPALGVSRVVCFSPRHDLTLAEMPAADIDRVLEAFQEQFLELAAMEPVRHLLMFENKGSVVGVSNPHPHGQIYATSFVFKHIENEVRTSRDHYEQTGRVILADILEAELSDGRRIIWADEHTIVFIPWFARYAHEVFIAPRETVPHIAGLSEAARKSLAEALRVTLIKLDNLWQMPFPYIMTFHQAPTDGAAYPFFHFHIEFQPPLRQPNLLKYLAGPEIGGGNYLNDTAPEATAAELKAQPETHYLHG
ncbi:MAG: UDPglucose--hexose-1-phosphate uridylyltransferase [Kiritimatiellia bacterium]